MKGKTRDQNGQKMSATTKNCQLLDAPAFSFYQLVSADIFYV